MRLSPDSQGNLSVQSLFLTPASGFVPPQPWLLAVLPQEVLCSECDPEQQFLSAPWKK